MKGFIRSSTLVFSLCVCLSLWAFEISPSLCKDRPAEKCLKTNAVDVTHRVNHYHAQNQNQLLINLTLVLKVGDGNRMLAVSDSSPTTSASSRGRGGAAATEIYASGSIELDDVAGEGRGKQSQSRAPPHQSERLRQQLLIEEQEDTLDQLSGTLGSLKQIGQDIDIEITYHNSLLVELNEAVDGTSSAMAGTQRRLKEITKSQSAKCRKRPGGK